MTWTPPDWTAHVLFLQYIANHLVLAALSHTLTLVSSVLNSWGEVDGCRARTTLPTSCHMYAKAYKMCQRFTFFSWTRSGWCYKGDCENKIPMNAMISSTHTPIIYYWLNIALRPKCNLTVFISKTACTLFKPTNWFPVEVNWPSLKQTGPWLPWCPLPRLCKCMQHKVIWSKFEQVQQKSARDTPEQKEMSGILGWNLGSALGPLTFPSCTLRGK